MNELVQRVASAEQDEEKKELEKELTIKRVKRDLADAKWVCGYVDSCIQLQYTHVLCILVLASVGSGYYDNLGHV